MINRTVLTLLAVPSVAFADPVGFNRDVRPILSDNCFFCHGPDKSHRKAGLRLDTPEGREHADAILERITSTDAELRMPPPEARKELAADQIEVIRRWIDKGAVYEPHWSFSPPRRPTVPGVGDGSWPASPIDRFILTRIEAAGRTPSAPSDRVTLLRRASFDLMGLPPTPADVRDFTADESPDAYERRVDRMSASPRFGERMAIYWLDLIRYADSVGYHGDQEHHVTPLRDYVIDAFNAGMPFDRFTREQLAGDLLPDPTLGQQVASGYNRVLQTSHEGGVQVKEYLAKYAADRVRNVSEVWMGATMGCAECHDHKFDPYTQKDFYSLAAFFADVDELRTFKGGDTSPTKREPEIVLPDGRRTMVTKSVEPRTMRVLARGDWMDDSGEVVPPAVPHFLPQIEDGEGRPTRLDLAEWLTSPEHPQTARVFVNRLWYLFLGRGLSDTLADTGSQGDWPSHPDLLDWMAVEFADDWDVKSAVRRIVISSTYRQASSPKAESLFAAQRTWRLPAEMIRDNALSVSGLLVERVGGASAHPYQPAGYYEHLNFPKREYHADTGSDQYRRGVYVHWQRQFLHPMLRAFDAPTREECTAKRPNSNTPLQALDLLNDPTFLEASRAFAVRILREGGDTDRERISWAWRAALSREPDGRELAVLGSLLDQSRDEYGDSPGSARESLSVGLAPTPEGIDPTELAAWAQLARAIVNLHEFLNRP